MTFDRYPSFESVRAIRVPYIRGNRFRISRHGYEILKCSAEPGRLFLSNTQPGTKYRGLPYPAITSWAGGQGYGGSCTSFARRNGSRAPDAEEHPKRFKRDIRFS